VVLAEPSSTVGLAIGHGVNPWYGVADAERMAAAVVDEAIRNVVAVGADPSKVALMDNFSWGDPRRPSTFGELVVTVDAICESSLAHGAPFISGKDSLNNEYTGSDGERHSVPPTLVITAVAHVPDADRTTTPDLKTAGNVLVVIGDTEAEFGGSHLGALLGGFDDPLDGTVPVVDPRAPERYRRLHGALLTGRIRACHDVSEGGLAVAVAEMAIGGRLGVRADTLPHADPVVALFAESTGRFVCELAPGDVEWLAEQLDEPVQVLGVITEEPELRLGPCRVGVADAARAFGAGGVS
jgi:phosphoribosylformylglycinamidine synthase